MKNLKGTQDGMVNQQSLNELALFAGAGGGILGGKLLGWNTVCAVEWEQYPASVLCARQNDGIFPPFPIWDDVQTFDGKPWRGIVDVVSGGFPCQDISAAGKGAGIDGERSGMWGEMARIIHEVRPKFVFVENSPMLTSRGLGRVLGDLASMGFDARWGVLGAADIGAKHQRDRIWIVGKLADTIGFGLETERAKFEATGIERKGEMAYTSGKRWESDKHPENIDGREICRSVSQQGENGGEQSLDNTLFAGLEGKNDQQESPRRIQQESGQRCNQVPNASSLGLSGQGKHEQSSNPTQGRERETVELVYGRSPDFWAIEPNVGRVADGVAARVDRLKAIGNGQVPLCAATAWRILSA
jgi:DNA (cytosine-5)-methyltransferase 1